ncbi:MAG TPA: ornithine cyclodeaminase family protein [Clostridia bacterium]|nr:ornithine cyclodeaminase family protein [Clostridia bacterium]
MNQRLEILFLSQEDVIRAGVLDVKAALDDVERAFRLHAEGSLENPPKTLMAIGESLFISMPVASRDGAVPYAGIKWAAESRNNIRNIKWAAESRNNILPSAPNIAPAAVPALPYGMDVVILSSVENAAPLAVMDGTLITAVRTAAATGVAVKYLALPDTRVACLVGCGVIGRTTAWVLPEVLPALEEIYLFDIREEKAEALARELNERWSAGSAGPVVRVTRVTKDKGLEDAVRASSVTVTMTTATKPFIKREWLGEGAFYAQIGTNEAEDAVVLEADRVVVDEWEQTKHYLPSMMSRLYREGRLTDAGVVNLREIVAGKTEGRRTRQDLVIFDSFGVACEDFMVASRIYEVAKKRGIGRVLPFWEAPKWL